MCKWCGAFIISGGKLVVVVVVVVTTVVWVAGAKVNCPNISSVDPSCTCCILDRVAPTSAECSFPGTTEGDTGPFAVEGRRRTLSTRKGVSGEVPDARVEGSIINTRQEYVSDQTRMCHEKPKERARSLGGCRLQSCQYSCLK